MFNLNAEIMTILTTIKTPFAYMFYEGDADTYITFMQTDKSATLAGDNEILGCVQFYDFDIFSKGDYLTVAENLIKAMSEAGWTYQPSRDSPDMYETDTKYYHKTLCFAKESEV